jgi:hypothetical protein
MTFRTWASVMLEKIGRLATRSNSREATGNAWSDKEYRWRQYGCLCNGMKWVRLLWSEAGAVCDLGFCA